MEKDTMNVFTISKMEAYLIDMEGAKLKVPKNMLKLYNKLLINSKEDEDNILAKHIEEVTKRGTSEIEFEIDGSEMSLLTVTSIVQEMESNLFDIIVTDGKEKPVLDAKSMVKNLESGKDPLEGIEEKSELVSERHTVRIWSETYTTKNNQHRNRLRIMDNRGNKFSVPKIQSLIFKSEYVGKGIDVAVNEELNKILENCSEEKAKVLKQVGDDAKAIEYIQSLPDDYKYLPAAGMLWKCGYKVTELLKDNLTKEQCKWLAENAPSNKHLLKIETDRPFELWNVDLAAIEYKVDYKEVYDVTDSPQVAEEKLVKFIQERERMIYFNTYTSNNSAIVETDEYPSLKGSKMKTLINEGKLTASEYLYMNDWVGIHEVKDLALIPSEFSELIFVKLKGIDMLYSYRKTEEGLIIGGISEADLKAQGTDVEIEKCYIEVLPITESRFNKLVDLFESYDEPYTKRTLVTDLTDKSLEEWKDLFEYGRFKYTEAREECLKKLMEEKNSLIYEFSSSDDLQFFSAMFADVKMDILFYDKEYGFRRAVTRLESSLSEKAGFKCRIKFGDKFISSSKFVRICIDTTAGVYRLSDSQKNSFLKNLQ